jgi:DtxR family transcriptional regulator, Mn-dependent transcriptional regulator
MPSQTEENYIKAIYKLSDGNRQEVSTNGLAEALQTKPASVSDMLRKLGAKEIINYVKYYGVSLTPKGERIALEIIRKHRLWEVFLVQKLRFQWDEVHDVAEELEHINSPLLVQRLDEYLGFPRFDPHGDPIPTAEGQIREKPQLSLADLEANTCGTVVGVRDSQPLFLQYLDKAGIYLGAKVKVTEKIAYDKSLSISIDQKSKMLISQEVSRNILIEQDR